MNDVEQNEDQANTNGDEIETSEVPAINETTTEEQDSAAEELAEDLRREQDMEELKRQQLEQQQPEQNYPQIVEHLDEEITQSNAEQEGQHMIHPFTQDQEQIQQLRLHQHSPNCRPPKPNGSGDEFIF